MKFVNFLLWIHQLPQNLAGFFMTRKPKDVLEYVCNDGEKVKVYFTTNVFGAGVSLGNYIILDVIYKKVNKTYLKNTINHEHGHQKQSRYLGWLYLIVVGLTSALFNNVHDRLWHKKWDNDKRIKWYYSRFPENWADKLGGVERFVI